MSCIASHDLFAQLSTKEGPILFNFCTVCYIAAMVACILNVVCQWPYSIDAIHFIMSTMYVAN